MELFSESDAEDDTPAVRRKTHGDPEQTSETQKKDDEGGRHKAGRAMLKQLRSGRTDFQVAVQILKMKHLQVRMRMVLHFAQLVSDEHTNIVSNTRTPDESLRVNAQRASGHTLAEYVAKLVACLSNARKLCDFGILGELPPGLASVDQNQEADRLWRLTVWHIREVAFSGKWYEEVLPECIAGLFSECGKSKEQTAKYIGEIWIALQKAEAVLLDPKHDFHSFVVKILEDIQFHLLQINRELFAELRKAGTDIQDFTKPWPEYILDHVRSWFELAQVCRFLSRVIATTCLPLGG